jgi:hypothetical protein
VAEETKAHTAQCIADPGNEFRGKTHTLSNRPTRIGS